MRKRNRLVSIIITAAMMIALMPAIAFADTYELWVGGVQVTDINKDNITGTPGVAAFDSDTNTLTLNNYDYTGIGHEFNNAFTESSAAAIYSGLDNLNITVKGVNELSNTVGDKNSYGIYAKNQLTVTEDSTGSLKAESGNTSKRSIGIYIYDNNFNVNGGKVTAIGGDSTDLSSGIWCFDGSITVGENAQLTGIGGDTSKSDGICAFDKIINNGGIIEGTGGETGEISHGIKSRTIVSTSDNSKTIGTAGSAKESAGIYLWDSTTFAKGYMKGIGGDVDIANGDVSYGIYVGDLDSEKLTVVKGATVVAEGETAAFNKEYDVVEPSAGAPGTTSHPDSSPNTGDNFALIGIIAVMVLAAAGVVVALVRRRS